MYPMNYFRQYSCCSLNQITTLSFRIKTKQEINKILITNEIIKRLNVIYNDIKIKDPSILSKKLFDLQDFKTLDEIKKYINSLVIQGADINYFNDKIYEIDEFSKKYDIVLNQELINDILYYKNGGVYSLRESYDETDDEFEDYDEAEDETQNCINKIKVYCRLLDYICSLKYNLNKDFSYNDLCIFLYSLNYNFMNDYDEYPLFKEMKYKNIDVLNFIKKEYLEKIDNFNSEIYLINHIIEDNNELVKDPLMIKYNSSGKNIELYYEPWEVSYNYPKILFDFKPTEYNFDFNIKDNIINGSIFYKLIQFISINFEQKDYKFSNYINKKKYLLFDNNKVENLKHIKIDNIVIKYILSYISDFIVDELKLNNKFTINDRYIDYKETDKINESNEPIIYDYISINNKDLLKMYYKFS